MKKQQITKLINVLPLLLIINFSLITCFAVFSQSGAAINTTGNTADPSAILDISSNNSGLLIPRLTTTERDNIISPASGLIIYNLTVKCFEFYENNVWQKMFCSCVKPLSPTGDVYVANEYSITWNWQHAQGAAGYLVNSSSDYSTATDVGNNTSYFQTSLLSNTQYELYIWSYDSICGNSDNYTLMIASTLPIVKPSELSGLYLWWDADDNSTIVFSSGNKVSSWLDKSGNNFTASQSNQNYQPELVQNAIGSKPALRFISENDTYLVNNLFTINLGNRTMFVIAQENAFKGYSGILSMRGTGMDYNSDDGYVFGNANNKSYYNMLNNTTYYNLTPAPTDLVSNFLPAGIYIDVAGSGTGKTYFNGSPFNDATGNTTYSKVSKGGISLGRRYEGGSGTLSTNSMFTGDIAEVIMYNRRLNNTEINQIGVYLSLKYNLNWVNL